MKKLPLQPFDDDGPVFNEPWEAQAFALVLALHEAEQFTWDEWARMLNEEIVRAQKNGDPDLGNTYYQHWLNALEKITLVKNISSNSEIHAKAEQWRHAYLSTPHGEPVELG
ncbi:MAG: nitrile hydratase accessory protein [Pseudomonadales bacterium]|nr:nitrile hydratase accessory protein [Pseudomonadales bacterium]